jgi:hypothetical protein
MSPGQGDGTRPRVAAAVPPNQKFALDVLADDRSSPGNRTYVAELLREAVENYLQTVDLPEEARDALDDDLIANAGAGDSEIDEGDGVATDGGQPTPRLSDGPSRETWPGTLDAAVGRLCEDDPDAVFLVTARRHEDHPAEGAWTGATVGIRPDLPGDVHDALVEDAIDEVLATLLLETDHDAVELVSRLAELQVALREEGSA